jgi:hypothetical protein
MSVAALRANILDSQRNGQKYRDLPDNLECADMSALSKRRHVAALHSAGGVQGYIAFLRGKRGTEWNRFNT